LAGFSIQVCHSFIHLEASLEPQAAVPLLVCMEELKISKQLHQKAARHSRQRPGAIDAQFRRSHRFSTTAHLVIMKAFVNTVLILFGSVFIFRALQPAWHPPITSPEAALQRLESKILPAIDVQTAAPITMDPTVTTASAPTAADRLPAVEAFPLYGGDALAQNPGAAVLRIEIVSSVEKADGRHPENRWLVDVAERFNQRRERIGAGPPIEVVVRAIPSGLGAQMLAAG
jgi:hypothetical protein